MELVELEGEVSAGRLQLLHEVGCACEQHPQPFFALLAARWNHSPLLRFGVSMIADLTRADATSQINLSTNWPMSGWLWGGFTRRGRTSASSGRHRLR
jgi:hypothetical protein